MDLVKAQALLSSGVQKSKIAELFGVTPGYISQLIDSGQLYDLQTNERDAKWDKIEDVLLDRVKEVVEHTTNPKALIALLRLANSAIRRGNTTNDIAPQTQNNTIININLPERAKSKLVFDDSNRLVALDNMPIMTVDRKDLPLLSKETTNNANQKPAECELTEY